MWVSAGKRVPSFGVFDWLARSTQQKRSQHVTHSLSNRLLDFLASLLDLTHEVCFKIGGIVLQSKIDSEHRGVIRKQSCERFTQLHSRSANELKSGSGATLHRNTRINYQLLKIHNFSPYRMKMKNRLLWFYAQMWQIYWGRIWGQFIFKWRV